MMRLGASFLGAAGVVVALSALGGCGTNDVFRAITAVKVLESNATDSYKTGDLGRNGSNLYAGYYDPINKDLKFCASADNGDTWGTPRAIDSTGDVGDNASLSVSKSTISLAYMDSTGSPKFVTSPDGGATWGAPASLGAPGGSVLRTLEGFGSPYCFRVATSNLDCLRYNAGWGAAGRIHASYTFAPLYPSHTINAFFGGSTISAFWLDGSSVNYSTSADSGASWSATPKVLSSFGETPTALCAACVDNSLFVVYFSTSNSTISFVKSSDAGATWSTASTKIQDGVTPPSLPAGGRWLALEPFSTSKLDVLYCNGRAIHITSSVDGGQTWTNTSSLQDYGADGFVAAATTTQGDSASQVLFLLYNQHSSSAGQSLSVIRSDDDGASWY
jgi:hypothetical protein